MEALKEVLEKSSQMELGSVCKDIYNIPKCEVCGETIGIAVKMSFGTKVYPRACRCRRETYEKQQREDVNRQKQIRLKQVISNSMMNTNFKKCTLENWNHELGNENLYNIAKQYISKFPQMKLENKGILIYGEPGNGKTYFSACIANSLLDKLVPVICVGAIALTERIGQSKRAWGDEGIKALRIKNDIGQKTMAKFLNMTVAAYSRKENGQRSFTINEVVKLSKFFKISIEELFL